MDFGARVRAGETFSVTCTDGSGNMPLRFGFD
jgi:hypothetical protein